MLKRVEKLLRLRMRSLPYECTTMSVLAASIGTTAGPITMSDIIKVHENETVEEFPDDAFGWAEG